MQEHLDIWDKQKGLRCNPSLMIDCFGIPGWSRQPSFSIFAVNGEILTASAAIQTVVVLWITQNKLTYISFQIICKNENNKMRYSRKIKFHFFILSQWSVRSYIYTCPEVLRNRRLHLLQCSRRYFQIFTQESKQRNVVIGNDYL